MDMGTGQEAEQIQAGSISDRAYEERLLSRWHERTGISGPLMRQLLNGAKVAARGGMRAPTRVPLVRSEVEAWLEQLVAVMPILGGLTVHDSDRKPGALGARYDTKIEAALRADRPHGDSHAQGVQRVLHDRFTSALFLAHAPSVRGQDRARVLAVATRLAGPTPTCRGIEVQLFHMTRLAQSWLDEKFEALIADAAI